MIPFGLVAGFADGQEIRITELAEHGFCFRTLDEIREVKGFRICFYDGINGLKAGDQEKKSREHQETSYFGDNRQAVLEDFFSSEEEEGENGRVSPVWVGMVLGIIGVLLYALAGYAVLKYVPQYLGTWAASGVMAILIVLI